MDSFQIFKLILSKENIWNKWSDFRKYFKNLQYEFFCLQFLYLKIFLYNTHFLTQLLDYGDGTHLNHLFFNVVRNRISGHFSKVRKKVGLILITRSKKMISVKSCYFYFGFTLVQKCAIPVINTRFRPP